MTNDELRNTVKKALDQALTISGELESDQADSLDYYYGRPYGNEVDGRSKVVTRDVLETIEWIMPSLLRVFASGNKTVQFDPVSSNDEHMAEVETKVVNHVFTKDNDGFEIYHNWFKDALLQKVGYVKCYWSEEEEVTTESYTGISDDGLATLLSDEGVEPVEHSVEEIVSVDEMGQQNIIALHDIKIKRVDKSGKLVIENVPQDEMRISKKATSISLNNCEFVAHVTEKTASDLIEMGYDKKLVDQLGDDEQEGELGYAREVYDEDSDEEYDSSMRPITVSECYIRLDYDGDGIAELRRIVMSGNHVLDNDEWDIIPFAALSPIPMPHKHIGLSEADLVMDLQLQKSTLIRQMLDNLYLTNNPEKEVVMSQMINPDDLLSSFAGSIKRVRQLNTIREITVPYTAGQSADMVNFLDQQKEARTGVSRHTMGLDADTLAQSTKGAFQTGLRQANQRIEMIARVFAETGVKDLFRKIHSLLIKHQDKARELNIDNEWIEINPTEWRERKSMSVVVGIGTGDKAESLQHLSALVEEQKQHLLNGSPLVKLKHLYNSYEKMVELTDLKDVDRFFADPDKLPPPEPPQPSAEDKLAEAQMQLVQTQAQIEQQKNMIAIEKLKLESAEKQAALNQKEQEMSIKMREIELKENLNESDKLELEKYKADLDSTTKLQIKEMDMQEKGIIPGEDSTLAIIDAMSAMQNALNNVVSEINRPKRIVRDENGNLIGVE